MSLILLWLSTVNQPSPCVPGAHVEKDESDPPQNRGGMRPKVDARYGVPLLGPIRVALVLIYPCGKAQKNPPFPSRLIGPNRSSPSRVRFAASRP